MRIIACERFGACLSRASPAAAIGRRWRWPKDFAPVQKNRPILPMVQSATVWSAWRCLPWGTWKVHGGMSSACWVGMSPGGRTSSGFNMISGRWRARIHSLILGLQGFADQAIHGIECNLVDVRASDHPVSLSSVLSWACPVAFLVGDLTLAERYIKALMDRSTRHTLELWNLVGRCFGGVLLVKRGEVGAGLELLRAAFARVP